MANFTIKHSSSLAVPQIHAKWLLWIFRAPLTWVLSKTKQSFVIKDLCNLYWSFEHQSLGARRHINLLLVWQLAYRLPSTTNLPHPMHTFHPSTRLCQWNVITQSLPHSTIANQYTTTGPQLNAELNYYLIDIYYSYIN
jgi:hypothetical protein